MGLLFFPRGGSAQVARYLARSLPERGLGRDASRAARSARPGEPSHAETFYAGLDVRAARLHAPRPPRPTRWRPTRPSIPPSRTARARPTASSPRVDDADYERLVAVWERQLADAGAAEADVLHLHHLTPINEAAERAFPDVPRIGHLHGTELLMLREIDEGPPPGWDHAAEWAERMRRWARGCERLLVLSPDAVRRVPDLLGVEPERVVLGAQRVRPGGLRPAPAQRGRAARALAALAGRGAARLGRVRASPAASPTPRSSWRRSRTAGRCCSTWAASPRSSACRC